MSSGYQADTNPNPSTTKEGAPAPKSDYVGRDGIGIPSSPEQMEEDNQAYELYKQNQNNTAPGETGGRTKKRSRRTKKRKNTKTKKSRRRRRRARK
jgi:hypothetical protein